VRIDTGRPSAIEFDDDVARVDMDVVWGFLSEEAYWGRWRSREVVCRQVRSAWRVVGAYGADGTMVGFARAVSDGEAFAVLADVFVVATARGRGTGAGLVEAMIERGPGADFVWMLHTVDAHGLYERFGFAPPSDAYLERPARGRLPLPSATPAVHRASGAGCPR
jgi:GNAT superfamily N-acetyltransferase